MRWLTVTALTLLLAACHTTDFGRSVGWPDPQGGALPSALPPPPAKAG